MLFLSAVSKSYYAFAAGVYGIILAILLLALIFGLRARRNVKNEKVTSLPEGFSPLDVKRIFIGKTYPRRLTRALITYWAECGYIMVEQLSKYSVRIHKIKAMPYHFSEDALFYDRGTYVRERDLFNILMSKIKDGKPINLLKSMFTKKEAESATNGYAVREDDGVYSSKHYTLKIMTILLSVGATLLAQIAKGINTGHFVSLIGIGTACIGLSVLMFVREMPIIFKTLWCGMWLGCSVLMLVMDFSVAVDPFGITVASVILLFVGPLFLVRFVDYREKINLDDYSDLVNYRRFLLTAPASELQKLDYYKVLPLLYALRIKPLVQHKFGKVPPPDWYDGNSETGGLL